MFWGCVGFLSLLRIVPILLDIRRESSSCCLHVQLIKSPSMTLTWLQEEKKIKKENVFINKIDGSTYLFLRNEYCIIFNSREKFNERL